MTFAIDAASPVPPYEQLRVQVVDAVADGRLVPGSKLPTVRRLAEELGLAVNTVARSYRELERDEVIQTRGRLGSFVAATGDATQRHAQAAATVFAERIHQLRVDPDAALALVRSALAANDARDRS